MGLLPPQSPPEMLRSISLGILPMMPCCAQNVDLPDSLVAMTGSSRKNLRGFDIQSQKEEEGRKDDDAYYATDGSL